MEDENSIRVTQAEFSRLMGVSRKTVTKWKSQGKIMMDGDLVDVPASREALDKFTGSKGAIRVTPNPDGAGNTKGRGNIPPAPEEGNDEDDDEADADLRRAAADMLASGIYATKADAELAKDTWMARMRQLQYERAAGLVVEVHHVARAVGESVARVRNRLLAIPAERAPEIHRCKTAAQVQDALMTAITEALEELIRPEDFEGPNAPG